MDHFGIGTAMLSMARVYRATARRTGRTESLINNVRDGDRIICSLLNERRDLIARLKQAGKEVVVVCIPPTAIEVVMTLPPCAGRTVFEHTWVEEYYAAVLARTAHELDEAQKHASRGAALLGIPGIESDPRNNWR